jgi:hypothetical protein
VPAPTFAAHRGSSLAGIVTVATLIQWPEEFRRSSTTVVDVTFGLELAGAHVTTASHLAAAR